MTKISCILPPHDMFDTYLLDEVFTGSMGTDSAAISAVMGIRCFGSSIRLGDEAVVRALNSFFAASMEFDRAASVDRLLKLASGDERTYLRKAADDQRPKICTLHRSTPALAKW